MMAERAAQFAAHVQSEMARVIVGQEEPLRQMLAVLLARGNALLEGVPGIAKTLAVKALARICGLEFQRAQGTPHLMPSDIVGVNVYSAATGAFTLRRGPVFTDLLLVDEVNCMPPRTQSALLECMEEHQVTLDEEVQLIEAFLQRRNQLATDVRFRMAQAILQRLSAKLEIPPDQQTSPKRLLECLANAYRSRARYGA